MFFHLIFVSSYSSQLGSLISFINHSNRIKSTKKKQIIFIIQFPTKGDPKNKYSLYQKEILNNYLSNFDLFIFKINNHIKRLVLWFIFLICYPLIIFGKYTFLWQPRPNWIRGIFSYKRILLPLPLPKKNIIYFGDGFLSFCKTETPFWLKKNFKKGILKSTKSDSEKSIFYYLYNIDYEKPSVDDRKINRNFINKIIIEFIKIKFNEINLDKNKIISFKKKKLFIFPTSTFCETARSTLYNEVNMYLDFILSKTNPKSHMICIKPHPGSNFKKTSMIENMLINKGYEIFLWENYIDCNDKKFIPINVLPLEIFVTFLINKFNLNYDKIQLVISSNASLSCLILHPKLITINAFSKALIKKYLKKEFVEIRLKQEGFIKKYIQETYSH